MRKNRQSQNIIDSNKKNLVDTVISIAVTLDAKLQWPNKILQDVSS